MHILSIKRSGERLQIRLLPEFRYTVILRLLRRRDVCTMLCLPAALGGRVLQAFENAVAVSRRVWADAATNLLGAPSLDGRLLSFVDAKTGDLAVRDLATGGIRRLTQKYKQGDRREFAYFSVISPDTKRVAYAWFNEAGFYELRVMDIDDRGSLPRVLFRNEEAAFVQPSAWSPDGKQILTLFFRRDNSSQIAMVSAEDGSARVLKSLDWVYPRKMDLSPDGRWIVYDEAGRDDGRSAVNLLAADASSETVLAGGLCNNLFPVWMRDGSAVLFASDRSGSMDLWSVTISGGKPAQRAECVRKSLGRFLPLGITTGGDYYYGLRAGSSEVYIGGFDSAGRVSSIQPLRTEFSGANHSPEWSPDGREIATLTRVGAENFGQESRAIAIHTLATSRARMVYPKLAYLDRIRWSPDGRALLVSGSDRGARRGLFRVDAENGATIPLLRESGSTYRGFEGVWAENGRALLYVRESQDRETIRLRKLDDTAEIEVYRAEAGATLRDLTLSPNERWFAFVASSADRDLLRISPLTGGAARVLASVPKDGISGVEWDRDSLSLLVSTPAKPVAGLWRAAVEGGKPRRLEASVDRQGGIRLAPDGRHIAFARVTERAEIWTLPIKFPREPHR